MARSFVYKRPLDAKTLSDAKNSNHIFHFNTFLEIKKEVEDDSLDMETELSAEASPATSSGSFDNHHPVLRSANTSEHQCNEGNEAPHPKLVIKFRDLFNKTEERVESTKKRKRNKEREPKNRILTMRRLRSNKRPRSEICASSENRMTRSFMLMQTSLDTNKGRRSTSNSVQQQSATDKEEQQDIWSTGRITRLTQNLNICEICGICFQSKRQLRAHESYYTGDGEFHCTICDLRYNRSWQLSRHDRVAHSKEENEDIYKFKCTFCKDRFDKKASLIAHVKHLHKLNVVPYKKSSSSDKELVSLHDISTRNTRKKTSARISESVRKPVEPINSEDHVIASDIDSVTIKDSNKLVRNLDNKEALLIHKISRTQQNDECLRNQLTDDNIHPNNKKVNAGSTQHPPNTTHAKHVTSSTLQTPVVSEAEAQEKSEDAQKKITEDLSSEPRFAKGNGAVRRAMEHNKMRRQMQCRSQAGSEVLSENIEPQLGGDLVDNLGNKVGKWCVGGPIKQPDETGNRSGSTEGSPTIDTADKSLEIRMANKLRCTRSSTLMMTRLLNSASTPTNIVTHSDQQSLQNEDPPTQKEGTNGTGDKDIIGKVCLDPENVDEKLLLQYDHLDEQVGSVSSHQISEDLRATRRNVTWKKDSDGAVVKCHNVDIDLIQVDNFVETHESAIVKCENEEMSDGSCESIDLKMTASSSNVSLTDSLSLESHDEITLMRCDTPNDLKIKDVRVLLVRLENMLDLSMKNPTPELSLLESCSIVKTEQPDYNPCDKQSELVLSQHSRRNHNYGEVGTNNESKSKTRKKRVTHNYHSNVIPINNRLRPNNKLRQGFGPVTEIRCYLCDEVFRSKFLAASHYLSMHTEVGVLQCCLCYSNFKSSRKLRIHLRGNCKIFYKKKCIKFCLVCKKRLRLPNLSQRCSECNRNSESEKCDSRVEQFPKVQDLTEHRSAHVLASDKMDAVENKTVSLFVIPPVTISRDGSKSNTTIIDHESAKNDKKVISYKTCKKNHQFKFKYIDAHDRLCKKKLHLQRRFRFSPIGSMNQHSMRPHRIRGVSKIRYDHKCGVCGLSCCCRKSLKIHKTRYSTNGNNVCNICGLAFAWKHLLVIHMKTAHNPKKLFHGKYKCEICHQAFYNTKFLRIHLAHFHNIKYFQCKICRIRFDTCRSLNNHIQYYSKNQSYFCGTCSQSFGCKYMLEYHKHQVHNHEKLKMYKYVCDVCNCAFIDELLLHAHISHFHNRQDCEAERTAINKGVQVKTTKQLPEDLEDTKIENVCISSNVETNNSTIQEQANKVYRSQGIPEDAVDETIRIHTSSEYKCGICKLSFNKPYDILNHEWEFSNDGIYACDVCNRKFITNSLLKTHKFKHYQRNVIREHECYVCREDFSRVDDLKMHGLHLHGPKFVWEKGVETADNYNKKILDSRIKCYSDDVLKKLSIDDAYDTIGLMESDEVAQHGKILFFQKISNNRSVAELLRRHSNEDAYCCHFCDINFSSAALLEDHIKKHFYRAYYTNSTRYLCLICKNKFRTNDILRAHVIYCHTSDKTDQTLSEPECLSNSIPNQLIQPTTELIQAQPRSNKQPGIDTGDNSAESSSKYLHPKQRNAKQPSSSRKFMSIRRSKSTSPRKENQSSNFANDLEKCQKDHGIRNSVPSEVRCKIQKHLKSKDLGNADDRNHSGLKSSESLNLMKSELTMEEVDFFTIKLQDGKGLEKRTCTICIEIFQSVAHFRKHFNSVHLKNGTYLCNLCGEEFSTMSDLKYHTLKHKQEPKNYVCCEKKFQLITDFVHHKLSHVEQIDSKRTEPNTQSLPLVEGGSFEKPNGEPNVDKTGNPCKCEVCDKAFVNFETMLKHWDSCIDTNGLQCHLCRARFKSRKWLRVHKMSHHEKKENCTAVQNRSTFRENSDETMEISAHMSTVHHNELGGGNTIDNSVNRNATQRREISLTTTDNISRENKLLKVGTITVKRFAQILPNLKNNGSCVNNEAKDMSSTAISREVISKQSREISKQRGIDKNIKTKVQIENGGKKHPLERKDDAGTLSAIVHQPFKSIPQVSQSDEQVSNSIPCNTNGNSVSHRLPVQGSNTVDKHLIPNDFSLSFQQTGYKEQRLSTLQPASSSTTVNSNSIQSMAYNCININNTRVASIISGQKSGTNDRGYKRTINLLPPSSNIAGSPAYYLCIPPAVNGCDNINNAMVVAGDFSNKSQPNNRSDKILSSLVPVSLNSGMSPTYYLCVQHTTDDSSTSSNHKVLPGTSKLKSHSNNRTDKRMPTIIAKHPNISLNPSHTADMPQIAHNSKNNSSENVSNDFRSRTYSNRSKVRKVPIILATAGTLTGGAVSTLHKQTTSAENTPTDKSASNTEAILKKQTVRCSYCSQLFTEKTKLIEHMASHRTDNQCPACGLKFSNERALQQHLPEHKCSKCTRCNRIFFFSDSTAYPTGARKFCSMCNSLLPLPTRRLSRSVKNSTPQVMKCGICMDTFGTISEMSVHFKLIHSTFQCGICGSRFTTKISLDSHMLTHGSESLDTSHNQCTICKKYFMNKSNLAAHALSHEIAQAVE